MPPTVSSIILLPWRRLRVAAILVYVAALVVTTILFFFLHFLGNQIPYDLAAQRFQTSFHPQRLDAGFVDGKRSSFNYCEFALTTMAGADQPGVPDEHWLLDVLMLRILTAHDGTSVYSYCHKLEAASSGSAEVSENLLKTRYWWGSKALFAIMLRVMSVLEVRDVIRWGAAAGYVALAAAILLLAPRTLLVLSPLIVLGGLFSGVKHYSDVASGLPYTWSVWALVWLAVLANPRVIPKMLPEARARVLRFSCFLIGTMSSYLWLFEGHTILVVTGIGMLVYFGHGHLSPAARSKLAGWCIALFIVGFAASFAMGQLTKVAATECRIPDWFGWRQACEQTGFTGLRGVVQDNFSDQLGYHFRRMTSEFGEDISGGISKYPVLKHFESFYVIGLSNATVGRVLTPLLSLATLGSIAFAVFRARRGHSDLLWGVSWIVGLIILAALQFLLPNDKALRIGRYVFVLYALGMSCSILALMHANILPRAMDRLSALTLPTSSRRRRRRRRRAPSHASAFARISQLTAHATWRNARWAGVGILASALFFYSLPLQSPFDRAEEIGSPVISSNFDVYLDGNKLIYVRDQCSREEMRTRFFLHITPVDVTDLPDDRRQYGFDNLDFDFYDLLTVRRGEACAVVRQIPDYEFTWFGTGQFTDSGTVWSGAFEVSGKPLRSPLERAEEIGSPVIRSNFDVYLDGDELIYVKAQCSPEDVQTRFFLHVVPADVADLPEGREQYGFDNLDFDFIGASTVRPGEVCWTVRKIPGYEFTGFSTGQFTSSGVVWGGTFQVGSE